ncbi:hypothetical protein OUZ56_007330 [Daphnia magna]|uniref:Uncharacterized protein n=1 Tax=Daphnia magna TaxID=35525 RepID=A0ABQ9YYE9_9CRUS|nr:hypothetical protein OUZ56_007330 [Daphnia magna]
MPLITAFCCRAPALQFNSSPQRPGCLTTSTSLQRNQPMPCSRFTLLVGPKMARQNVNRFDFEDEMRYIMMNHIDHLQLPYFFYQ